MSLSDGGTARGAGGGAGKIDVEDQQKGEGAGERQAEPWLRDHVLKELLWKRAAGLARMGHWIWDDDSDRCLYCSDELAALLEMPVEEYMREMRDSHRVARRIHPDDRRRYLDVTLADAAAAVQHAYAIEVRIYTKTGRLLHIRETADPVYSPEGAYQYTIGIVQDITAQKEAEGELRQARDAMTQVLDSVALPLFVLDPGGAVALWNAAAERTFGWPSREVLGRASPVLDGAQVASLRQRQLALRAPGTFEIAGRHRDGRALPLSVSLSWLDGRDPESGLVVIAVDLTSQRAAEAEAERRRDQMRFAMETLPVPLTVSRYDTGEVVFNNAASQALFGIRPGVKARALSLFYDEENRRLFFDTLRRDGRVEGLEICCRDVEGRPVWLAVTSERISFSGVDAIASVALDISQLRQAHDRLRQAQRMEAVGQLTGGIAHDFNNLLTVILGNAEALQAQPDLSAEAQGLATLVVHAAERGSVLTRQLLAFARRQPLTPAAVDLSRLLEGLQGLLRSALPGGVTLRFMLGGDLPPANADAAQLEAAVLNLVLNARDALPRGGEIVIATRALPPQSADAPALLEILVTDDGEGMSAEVQAHAFEPFFTTKEVGKGSGLGLSSVYGFAQQSGGSVWIESAPGRGTRVGLRLPAARVAALATSHDKGHETEHWEGRAAAGGVQAADGHPCTVLLVEDERSVRDYVAALLKDLGHRVLIADSAPAALPLLEKTPELDLLLTDLVMPGGMSGQQLAAAALRGRPGMPVLLMSGYSRESLEGQELIARLPLLRKPFNRRQFTEAVRAALDRPAQPAT